MSWHQPTLKRIRIGKYQRQYAAQYGNGAITDITRNECDRFLATTLAGVLLFQEDDHPTRRRAKIFCDPQDDRE